ncbi:SRPBCC domain-containing protein [Taibaiella koreensis]|uniref:SRPBCC domain-containing protein n=1 Tax=Taibaiella koreensis TaxID=1268548 RepID=UPI000E59A992|nr:SRPBCC domain-containing protein [Taibaiella koreensis]
MSSTRNERIIAATPERLYRALTDPAALSVWLAPGDMTGEIHHFDLREGGGYEMSLYYPDTETGSPGKTGTHEDRFSATFTELAPNKKVVQAIRFDSDDPAFGGKMQMTVLLEPVRENIRVTFLFTDIPPGIRPEDNTEGTEQSLDKLERYVTQGS